MKQSIFRAFLRQNLDGVEHSGEGIAAINTDADIAGGLYGGSLFNVLLAVLPTVTTAVVIFAMNYLIGLIILVVGLVCVFVQGRFAKPLGKIGKETLETNAEAVKRMSDVLSGGLVIRAYSLQDKAQSVYGVENGKLLKLSFQGAFINMLQASFTTFQGLLTILVLFGFGGFLVAMGRLELATLMALVTLAETFTMSLSRIGGAWAGLQAPIEAGRRIYTRLDGKRGFEDIENESPVQTCLEIPRYDIEINDMSFTYKNAESKALDGVTLTIKENEFVAFVGESGSGKSTLLRVIAGFYERDGLGLRLGDEDFSCKKANDWRRKFACVDQSCKLFDMTISENIALGKNGATLEEVQEAAVLANADGFIRGLENGYNASAGEKGASLSGGQKQRIAIARALIRKAPILVFDEATSALDMESERQVMETILNLRKGHTILMSSHNLKNVETADRVVLILKGKVEMIGSYAEVIERLNNKNFC